MTIMTTRQRFDFILRYFSEHMPEPEPELHYGSPFELLVAVMLSAQCTDKRVNLVTPALFAAYPTAESMAQASVEDILAFIRSVSYPNAKAQHLSTMSKQLVADFGGQVPDSVEALTTLTGVGRKTANVVCAVLWNQPAMAVDTHIFRVAERIGLTTNSKNPLQTEQQLVKFIPAELIPKAHHWLLLHGRYVCTARQPRCLATTPDASPVTPNACPLTPACRFFAQQQSH